MTSPIPPTGDFYPYSQEAEVTIEFMIREGYKPVKRYSDNVYERK